MKRTALALSMAPVAADARLCAGVFGHGYQWRSRSMASNPINETTKRPARHLGIAST